MALKTFMALLVVVVAVVVIIAMQPSDFRVSRRITIAAPPTAIFERVNNLHSFNEFSPWAKIDPKSEITFEGPDSGVGSSMAWSSANKAVGKGKMTVVESVADQRVQFRLDFLKPFTATNTAEFLFTPSEGGTTVTWSMAGSKNFLFKAVGIFMDCDKMVGKDFEKGLANLKSLVESGFQSGKGA